MEHAKATPPATSESVTRYALLMRRPDGKAELLPRLFSTATEAELEGKFWASQRPWNETAELLAVTVPTHGTAIKAAQDLLP